MDQLHYAEMKEKLGKSLEEDELAHKSIFLFGHCEATLALADELERYGLKPEAILDNSDSKTGLEYRGIVVKKPEDILKEDPEKTIVLIVTRFYEAMKAQLEKLGFVGRVRKLLDFNTFAEYSLSERTLEEKSVRCKQGCKLLDELEKKYPGCFFVLCPFPALGDIYFCMSWLPGFMEHRGIKKAIICVPSHACAAVAALFGQTAEIIPQRELEAAIQAVFWEQIPNAFVAHQDRPYLIRLHQALRIKKIPLDVIYRTGVFGLDASVKPAIPTEWSTYPGLHRIARGKSVILSPYAKSVTALPMQIWGDIVSSLQEKGYLVFTNVAGDEKPLSGTEALSPAIAEMKSVAEEAGLFIGIRSGLCDILRTADCRKIALYPDYHYCDTKWKAIDMYALKEFENIVVGENDRWQMN